MKNAKNSRALDLRELRGFTNLRENIVLAKIKCYTVSGPAGSIIYADQYGSIKIKLLALTRNTINKDLCGSMRINFDQF